MILDTNKILKEVLDMRKDLENNLVLTKDKYKEKYNYMSGKTPTLFEIVYKNEGNYLEYLNFMINNAHKLQRNEVNQYDADVTVGTKLAKDFVYSNIDMSKEKIE